ncbi:ChbG/HpnK family deacetylase [Pusillimonas sp. NJUB218]|uniref:ChbG/HpnK family deacetylase n=1 Tax=Pusillimonas sp. NJUB218 TaxID=2023230 RepID=UPI000F4C5F5F|nr:ChbG/HpnK family deacetylase [Pusillimonas sp. NJUB218]ROT45413.1 hypothetical protein CHR62_06575 [Pusillimonas sp. NJUB218]
MTSSQDKQAGKCDLKPLIVCADDFGMNPAANRAILALADAGRLSATSCLVDGPYFVQGAAALLAQRVQKGLHLNFTDDLGQPGLHQPLKALIRDAYLYRLDVAAVRAQIVRQLDRFEAVMGQAPDYADGHLHVHQLPQIRDELVFELSRRYANIPGFWLRSTQMRSQPAIPARLRFKARVIQALGAGALVRLAHESGFDTNVRFLGAYDFQGGEAAYGRWLEAWVSVAQSGDVMMCHPEQADAGDTRTDPQRNAEFKLLSGPVFADALTRYGVRVQV